MKGLKWLKSSLMTWAASQRLKEEKESSKDKEMDEEEMGEEMHLKPGHIGEDHQVRSDMR